MPEAVETALKILIADDSNSDRLLLKTIVQKQGHIPILASDGVEAIALFQSEKPDIVLLDALMPRLDGFETAKFIKAHSGDSFVPIIFLTSLSEADSLARCLQVGGDDFLTKPYNHIILQAKINAFWRMLKMHVMLQEQRDQIVEHNVRLVREQEVAKLIFDKIAHEGALNAPNVRYCLSPMAIFNGDVLLAALRPNGNLCVLLGDFTGHGLAAAIGAMPLSQSFYSMVSKGFQISEILVELNSKLKEILPVGVFCCAVMLDMDFHNKRIEIWNGGMPDCYLYHQKNQQITSIASEHLALGILSPQRFSAKTRMIEMHNQDRLFIWSDGIIEAENKHGEMFGEQRLRQVFAKNTEPEHLFEAINGEVARFVAHSGLSDDLSVAEIMMVDFATVQRNLRHVPIAHRENYLADWLSSFEFRAASLRESEPLQIIYKNLINLPGLSAHSLGLFTVLSELYSNALEHGVLGLSSALKNSSQGFAQYYEQRFDRLANLQQGFVRFDINYLCVSTHSRLCITVSDSGDGFDLQAIKQRCGDSKYSGRGLTLIDSFCKHVEYLGRGNQVRVIFEW